MFRLSRDSRPNLLLNRVGISSRTPPFHIFQSIQRSKMSSHTHSSDPNCIFCRILSGSIPSTKLYEDSHTLAFLDINPSAPGHTLVIPKAHSADLTQMSKDSVQSVFSTAQLMGSVLKSALAVPAFNLIMNNGKESGQIIFHSHVHLVPQNGESGRLIAT